MSDSTINSGNVIVFVIAGLVVISLLFGFIVFFLISYRQKKKDFVLMQLQKNEIESQKKTVEKTLEELASAQNQLIQSEKMASLGVLIAGISHELQNPLNFVNNFSEINKELIEEAISRLQNKEYEAVVELLQDILDNDARIHSHGKRADSIIKGMLNHSRNNPGEKTLTDINALAEEFLRLSYHGYRARDKQFNSILDVKLDPTIEKIPTIPQDLSRVFLNLFTNACYAVNEKKLNSEPGFKPKITLETINHPNTIEIHIQDNGNGIPEAIISKIFQPFFTTKPTGQGTGLGLSLSYDIIKNTHGGEISVTSKMNEGTTFTIILNKK
ncbi:MAG: GHKL domain-containing protein [Saprospiraceae bacterium]|nr:GHKL domain-containing protein [Saprospiraceae bacterium]